ncbi:MAG: LysR family hydrogen peroxide-inducible transcriptional activator [Flavobacteriales bacterium]|jgi:LysR family hydrogen peroxide-inducible transcriptional activator
MTLTELRYIVTLAQEQHFGRAAERCFVSQPTLSIAVKKLEEELKVVIFERSKTRVYATPVGEKIIKQAQTVIEAAAAVKDIASSGKNQLTTPMHLGAIFTIGPYLFPHLIPELQARAKDMPLYIEESYTATLRKRIRQGDLDAIVVALPFTEADVLTQTLYEEEFVILMDRNHPLIAFDKIDPSQLDDYNVLLLGEGHCFRDQVLKACPNLKPSKNDNAAKLRTAAEGSSLETMKHMVASGLGITILPASAASTSPSHTDLLVSRPFVEPVPKRTVALAWRASFPRTQAIDALREAIQCCRVSF